MFDAHFHPGGISAAEKIFADKSFNKEHCGLRGFCCSSSENDWEAALQAASEYCGIIPCLGIHPWHAADFNRDAEARLRHKLIITGAFIGEAGLDFLQPHRELQEKAFESQLRLAAELKRPIMLHCVKAWGLLAEMLKTFHPPCFIVHSFGASLQIMKELSAIGGYFSFGPGLAEPRRKKSRAAFAQLLGNAYKESIPNGLFLFESEGGKISETVKAAAEIAVSNGKYCGLEEAVREISAMAEANASAFLAKAGLMPEGGALRK